MQTGRLLRIVAAMEVHGPHVVKVRLTVRDLDFELGRLIPDDERVADANERVVIYDRWIGVSM